MTSAYGPLADRPVNPKVGLEIPHESAALHATGIDLYTEDLVGRHKDVLHAWPLQAPHAHARVVSVDTSRACTAPNLGGACLFPPGRKNPDPRSRLWSVPLAPGPRIPSEQRSNHWTEGRTG